jgi:hypothetical protein
MPIHTHEIFSVIPLILANFRLFWPFLWVVWSYLLAFLCLLTSCLASFCFSSTGWLGKTRHRSVTDLHGGLDGPLF